MMQFNPLFLNDIKGNKTLTPNSGKVQKNKYLFSEIITVVMKNDNNEGELKKLSPDEQTEAAELVGGTNSQVIEQLQNKIISEAENEEMKIQLSDILPEDMAKLLTNDEAEINDKNIVSYIGKEQMQGDLQNFLTGLVGEKVFEKHVTDNSGVLIKMEDAKSSVNIEVTKEINNNAAENKTMVKALIIPEKGKVQLLPGGKSLLSELENTNTLKKIIDTGKVESLEKELGKEIFQKAISGKSNSIGETTKPTLSVFSFKVEGAENIENNFTGKLKELVKKNENELENIVKSTKFLNKSSDTNETQNKIAEDKLNDKKIILNETKETINKKDINISKITIIKKQNLTPTQEIINSHTDLKNLSKSSGKVNTLAETDNKIHIDNIKTIIKAEQKVESKDLQKDINSSKETKNNVTNEKQLQENTKENVQTIKETNVKGTQQAKNTINNINIDDVKKESAKPIRDDSKNERINKKDILIKDDFTGEKKAKENNINTKNNNSNSDVNNVNNNYNNKNLHNHKTINKNTNNSEKNFIENQTNPEANKVVVEKAVKNLIPNKKVSVKVKKVVKSINGKPEQEKNISSEIRMEQKENQTGDNTEFNNSKGTMNLKNSEFDVHSKKKADLTFQHIIQKEQNFKLNETGITQQNIQQQNTDRIVKSIEVIKEISRFISAQKKGSLSFTIKPEHLGHLKITLETNNHLINAHIQVENEQAKLLVEKNLNQLHTQLQENGVELNSLNISLGYSSNSKESYGGKNKHKQIITDSVNEETAKNKKETKTLGYNTYEYLA